MKTKTLIFTLFLLLFVFPLFADECGEPVNCSMDKKYPYINHIGNIECLTAPNDYISNGGWPPLLLKHTLPLQVGRTGWMHRYVGDDSSDVKCLAPFKEYGGYQLLDAEEMLKELQEACDAWNCVCGYPPGATGGDSVDIWFNNETLGREGNTQGVTPLTVSGKLSRFYINLSPNLLYRIMDTSLDYNDFDSTRKIKNLYYNLKYFSNVIAIWDSLDAIGNPDNVHIYSFRAVAMHEIGHIFGLGHYDDCDSCYDDTTNRPDGLMNQIGGPTNYPFGLSDDDKCMFAKLYCPGIVGIKEELPAMPNISVSPNPATGELNISFEVLDGVKPVTIRLCNEQGQILYTFMSEVMYSAGTHTYNAKLDLPTGIYFILTTINKTMYSEKFIAK